MLLLLLRTAVLAPSRPFPLAGVTLGFPLTASQAYPMDATQSYPITVGPDFPLAGTPQTYPLQ